MTALDITAGLCMRFEGFRSKPYLCPAGVATIGYGSTAYANGTRVTLKDAPITREAATGLLEHELRHTYFPGVLKSSPELSGNALAAMADFAYNLGVGRYRSSTLRKCVNAGDWDGAKIELRKWVRGGGRVLPGLVLRREAETALL